MRSDVLTAIRWTASTRLMSQIVTWAITLIVIRFLTPADYGLLAMATIFLSVLLTVADVGIGPGLVQKVELGDEELRQAFGIILVFHLAFTIALVLLAPWIAEFFQEPRLALIIRVLSLQFVIGAFAIIPDAVLQRKLEFRNRSLLDLAAVVTGSLVTLGVAVAGGGVWALVFGSITTQAIKTVGINVFTRCLRWPVFSLTQTRLLLTTGGQVTLTKIIWSVYVQADAVIAGKLLGKEALGYYSLTMHLASLPTQRISALVSEVAFPAFSRMQSDLPKVAANTLLGVRVLSLVSFPVLWGISSVAPEFVKIILGPKWIEAIAPLQILALVMPLRTISTFLANPIAGLGRFDIGLANVIVSLLIMVPSFVIGVQWGLMGLCFAWLISMPIVFIVAMWQNTRVVGIPLLALFAAMLKPLIAASVMYVAIVFCRAMVFADFSDLARFALLTTVGGLAYAAITLLLNKKGLVEIRDLLGGIAGRRSGNPA